MIPSMFRKQQRDTLSLAVGGLLFANLYPSQIQADVMQADWVKAFMK